ncbi:dihydrofolate reductase family protein [Flavobacterium ustbae]|uniref:dihydrofolate reductase family protein n=1 Tax=Flavobacterium ustbae TaxID=2488790 RepID=UPI0013DDE03D|nr:dihydrofolate reductase family protein [Flavobacterium ustbae]
MRKIKLQINITIDGFVGGENGELDWMLTESDQKQIDYLNGITENVDTILLGRKMALESIPHWQKVAESASKNQETDFAQFFTETQKIVFSKNLQHIDGKNVVLENGNLKDAIQKIKDKPGADVIVYGGANFVSSLLKENLLDELNLFVHPVSIGKGLSIFNEKTKLKLIRSEFYTNGIVLNKYEI